MSKAYNFKEVFNVHSMGYKQFIEIILVVCRSGSFKLRLTGHRSMADLSLEPQMFNNLFMHLSEGNGTRGFR